MSSDGERRDFSEEEEEEEFVDSHEQDRRMLLVELDDMYFRSLDQHREKLISQRNRLRLKYDDLKNDLTSNEQHADDYETERDSLLKAFTNEQLMTGDFFHRMKALEFKEAQFRGELKGYSQAIKVLSEQIKLQEKRNERLQKKLDAQLSNLPDGALLPTFYGDEGDDAQSELERAIKLRRMEGSQNIKQLQTELQKLEAEIEKVQEECEMLRDAVKDKSARLQTIPSDNIDKFQDQKIEIDNEIELKKKQLRQLLIDEKKLVATKSNDVDKERAKAELMENGDPWENERKNLLNAIQHTQNEFQELCTQLNIDPDNIPEQRSVYGDKRSPSQLSINESKRSKAPSSLSESRNKARKRLRDDESDARSRISQRSCATSEKVRYTHELLRTMIKKELDSLKEKNHPINIAIEIETRYGNELDEQLDFIKNAIKSISNFERETFEQSINTNQDSIMWQQRMDVLQNEYLELRSELRDTKA